MRWMPALMLFFAAQPGLAADITLPEYERVELANGTVLLLSEKHEVPLIGMRAVLRGGAVTDGKDRQGLAQLFAELIQKGAGERDAAAFAEAAAAVGGQISASADTESITVSAEFLARDVELLIELVADVLMRPALAEDEFEKLRSRAIDIIKAAKDSDPSDLLPGYGYAFLFGDHPYGNPASGSETSLAGISHDDLVAYYANQVGADRLIIAVAGDFDLTAMKAHLGSVFEGWRPAAEPLPAIAAPERTRGRRVLLVDKPGATQTYFWIGNVGVGIDYPRHAEMRIANTLFGGRFTSMLMTALRIEGGLTYSAYSNVQQLRQGGSLTIRSFTETGQTIEAIDMAIDLLEQLHTRGVNDDMIASARNYIMGQFPPTLETASAVASMVAFLEANGLDRGYIDNYGAALEDATPVTVHNAISEVYPEAADLAFILIGDAEAIRDDIAKYGPVTEISIKEPRFQP